MGCVPHCLDCGACCFGDFDEYVAVTGDDHARLADDAEELTHFVGNRCYMKMSDGHCAALQIRAGRFFCRVYETRPTICRTLERESGACRAERAEKLRRTLRVL